MGKEIVYIAKGSDSYSAAKEAIDFFGLSVKNRRVLIKPNLTVPWSGGGSINTSTATAKAVLEALQACSATIGDAGLETKGAFKKGGWQALADEFGARLVDFNDGKVVWKKIPRPVYSEKMPFAETVFENDFLVNCAKLKVHSVATVTLCMKNLFGCVPTRGHRLAYHSGIRKAILDINQVVKSDFCIVDGIIGNEFDEVQSHPVKSGIVVAGENALAVDLVAARCMGIDPEKIDTYRLAEELFGKPKVVVKGAGIEEVRKNYRTSVLLSSKMRLLGERALGRFYRFLGQ